MNGTPCDIAVIGGGIVGLATALALNAQHPALRLTLLEKEPTVAAHQTGRNSGVTHSGIYYKPGSYKARLSVEGRRLMAEYCETRGIRIARTGKVIVATTPDELPRLQTLFERGTANGVEGLELIGPERVRELEPHATTARQAIWSPHTGSIDFGEVARAMQQDLLDHGVRVLTGAGVTRVTPRPGGWVLHTPRGEVEAAHLVACAGLHADEVARLTGARPDLRIVPFRGEYYLLRPDRQHLVQGLIYPVPDPSFPFLGVHLTRTVHDEVEAGPNAVLALAREGYRWRDVNPRELAGTLSYRGFWSMAARHWRMGLHEIWRSASKAAFTRSLQRLLPDLREDDLARGGAGVRAQAVAPDGSLADDFRIQESPRAIHVLNAPSPAATASLAIGRYLAERATKVFAL